MPKYLLDTNACIAIRNSFSGKASKDAGRKAAQERLIARWKAMPASDLAMSYVSLGELSLWAEKHSDPSRAKALLQRVAETVELVGLPLGSASGNARAVAGRYGRIRADLEQQGACIGGNDLWIAAHAAELGLTVVTGNTSEFKRVAGLAIEDWTA